MKRVRNLIQFQRFSNRFSSTFSLALLNCKIYDVINNKYLLENSIGIRNDKISFIGSSDEVLLHCDSNTKAIDIKNSFVLPGFTDSHCHFLDGGLRLLSVQLRDVKTKEEFREKLKEYIQTKEPGTWILGGDWNHYNFGGELPTREWIDDVSLNNPVWLNRMDGHMSLANSYALKLCGINNNTCDIPGGTIVRDSNGILTGILKDNACNLVTSFIPRHSPQICAEALEKAMDYVSSKGVTKVHTMVTVDCVCGLWPKNLGRDADKEDMEIAYEELEVYHKAFQHGKLRTRIQAALPLASWKRLLFELNQNSISSPSSSSVLSLNNDWLKATHLKAMIDGSLGSHTAAFHEPYSDDKTKTDRGHMIWDEEEIEKYITGATQNDLQVMIHAIGDRANHQLLNIFEKVQKKLSLKNTCHHHHHYHHHNNDQYNNNNNKYPPFRVEHAQHITPSDIPRFGQLGIIASMQMSHLAEDGCWSTQAIGEER